MEDMEKTEVCEDTENTNEEIENTIENAENASEVTEGTDVEENSVVEGEQEQGNASYAASEDNAENANEETATQDAPSGDENKPKRRRSKEPRAPKPILDENGNEIERLSTEKAMRVLEAILFANGDEVYYDQFARIIGYTTKEAKSVVETYAKLYDNGAFPRGIRLVCYEKCCQLSTYPDMSEYVKKMIGVRGEPQLSNAAMETLAIIAYHQPITRAFKLFDGDSCNHCV